MGQIRRRADLQGWGPRHELAGKRLRNILRSRVVANARILEQKISDAGPTNQRIDPHILTEARVALQNSGAIGQLHEAGVPWYYLLTPGAEFDRSPPDTVKIRLAELARLHSSIQKKHFNQRIGQALEIAVSKALESQSAPGFQGYFENLDAHDDSTLYTRQDPPPYLSGRSIGNKRLDFLVNHPTAGFAGIEREKRPRVVLRPRTGRN
jgi:hypothetical protein